MSLHHANLHLVYVYFPVGSHKRGHISAHEARALQPCPAATQTGVCCLFKIPVACYIACPKQAKFDTALPWVLSNRYARNRLTD